MSPADSPFSSAYLADARALATAGAMLRHGVGDRRATCELSFAALPPHYGFLVMAGVEDSLQALEQGPPSAEEMQAVQRHVHGVESILERLNVGPLRIDIDAAPDGTVVFAHEPVVIVEGRYADVLVAMAVVRACVTRATAIATRTMRRVLAAEGKSVVDGSAVAHQGESAERVARAAHIGGADATTALRAGLRLRLPICTLAEDTAFSSRHAPQGRASDGWGAADVMVEVDTPDPEMALLAQHQRVNTASHLLFRDLDAPALLSASIDLVALEKDGAWSPCLGLDHRPSVNPGRKLLVRYVDGNGAPVADIIHAANERIQTAAAAQLIDANGIAVPVPPFTARGGPFTLALWRGGRRVGATEDLAQIRQRARSAVTTLPPGVALLHCPAPYPVGLSSLLMAQKAELMARPPLEALLQPRVGPPAASEKQAAAASARGVPPPPPRDSTRTPNSR